VRSIYLARPPLRRAMGQRVALTEIGESAARAFAVTAGPRPFSGFICFTSRKMAKAMMKNEMMLLMNRP